MDDFYRITYFDTVPCSVKSRFPNNYWRTYLSGILIRNVYYYWTLFVFLFSSFEIFLQSGKNASVNFGKFSRSLSRAWRDSDNTKRGVIKFLKITGNEERHTFSQWLSVDGWRAGRVPMARGLPLWIIADWLIARNANTIGRERRDRIRQRFYNNKPSLSDCTPLIPLDNIWP